MADKRNFLLGYGERLIEPVQLAGGGRGKEPPYSFEDAKARLSRLVASTSQELSAMPSELFPNDRAVLALTLHPEYLAKSHFPSRLLDYAGMSAIGSKTVTVKPAARSHGRTPTEMASTKLFVSIDRKRLSGLESRINELTHRNPVSDDLAKIEALSSPAARSKLISLPRDSHKTSLEVVLHGYRNIEEDRRIQDSFTTFIRRNKLASTVEIKFYAGGLSFAKVIATPQSAEEIGKYSFVRAIRTMPLLRPTESVIRGVQGEAVEEPKNAVPLSPEIRVAIFDGGLSQGSPLLKYANAFDTPGVGAPDPDYLAHGEHVTSALLFGPILGGKSLPRPYVTVDHYRVLDDKTNSGGADLYPVLDRIEKVLRSREYAFVNLSIGPALSVEDDDVHPWTAVLDDLLQGGKTLVTAAAGNTGHKSPPPHDIRRVQVPSDCVNALTMGAADSQGRTWQRADYSSIGPGRSPGRVKPDAIAFGGTSNEPFLVYDQHGLAGTSGTSFSAPATLRMGAGIQAMIGSVLTPLAIKALLINTAERSKLPRTEIGWGRINYDLNAAITSNDDCVRIIYQDRLGGGANALRAPIPLPAGSLTGPVHIAATFCFASPIDVAYSDHYTRAGLEILFRPDDTVFADDDALHPATASFFRAKDLYMTEAELRKDAHKWETCLHHKKRKRAETLRNPVFDIRFHQRLDGHPGTLDDTVPFALVIDVRTPKMPDLYNQVVRRYQNVLQVLKPVIEIPVRASV